MPKAKISRKQKKFGMKSLRIHEPFTSKELKNPSLVAETLLECIKTGDIVSARSLRNTY